MAHVSSPLLLRGCAVLVLSLSVAALGGCGRGTPAGKPPTLIPTTSVPSRVPGEPQDPASTSTVTNVVHAPQSTAVTEMPPPVAARTQPAKPKSAAAVMQVLPESGPVRVVTVRSQEGKPVFTTLSAHNRAEMSKKVAAALADPQVTSVQAETRLHAMVSNDTYRANQWGLDRVQGEAAWADQPGAGVTVAVIDSGVAIHPDLAGAVLAGKDYLDATGDGSNDVVGHGTHVAGIIAAVANNSEGVAGVAQGVKILPIRVLDANGGSDADIADGIVWATDRGAKVINLSLGGPDYSDALAAAVNYATSHRVVVVASAGNSRANVSPVMYPAALPNVIAVTATDDTNTSASFSNIGSYIDIAAPGVSILSTVPGGGYEYWSGTSMAAPFVAASAALVAAATPMATPAQVQQDLQSSALDVGPVGHDNETGYGVVQADAAIRFAKGTKPTALTAVSIPTQAAYRTAVSLQYKLTSGTVAVAGVPVQICVRYPPSLTVSCATATTTSSGVASRSVGAWGNLVSYATHAAQPQWGYAKSYAYVTRVLPAVNVTGGYRAFSLAAAPWSSDAKVVLQKYSSGRWMYVTQRSVPSTGRLTITQLTRGTYRVVWQSTVRTTGTVSRAVWVR